jgi:hypothetical protein
MYGLCARARAGHGRADVLWTPPPPLRTALCLSITFSRSHLLFLLSFCLIHYSQRNKFRDSAATYFRSQCVVHNPCTACNHSSWYRVLPWSMWQCSCSDHAASKDRMINEYRFLSSNWLASSERADTGIWTSKHLDRSLWRIRCGRLWTCRKADCTMNEWSAMVVEGEPG